MWADIETKKLLNKQGKFQGYWVVLVCFDCFIWTVLATKCNCLLSVRSEYTMD